MAEKYVSVSELRKLLGIPSDGQCTGCQFVTLHGCKDDSLRMACEAIDDAPEAVVVDKTEWDKLMFLVEAANNVLESAPKWIPVNERLPEKGQVVLAFGTRSATTGQFRGVATKPNYWWWKGNTTLGAWSLC